MSLYKNYLCHFIKNFLSLYKKLFISFYENYLCNFIKNFLSLYEKLFMSFYKNLLSPYNNYLYHSIKTIYVIL